jgi:gliding motility-associated-like protein
LKVQFSDASSGATQYFWDFGNGETSSEVNPAYVYKETGHFNACLTTTTSNNCSDKVCMDIEIYINTAFDIPNVFTPNGDGKNDVFTITGKGIRSLHGEIFNRWGQKEYEWNTINGGWDGHSASGMPCNDGTYFLLLEVVGEDGKIYPANKAITLLR